jgi:hypothetical protein
LAQSPRPSPPPLLTTCRLGTSGALLTSDDDTGRASSERRSFIRYGMSARLDRHRAGAGYVCRAAWSLGPALDDLGGSESRAAFGAMRPFRRGPSDDDQRAAFGQGSYRSHWRSTVSAVELVLLEVAWRTAASSSTWPGPRSRRPSSWSRSWRRAMGHAAASWRWRSVGVGPMATLRPAASCGAAGPAPRVPRPRPTPGCCSGR